MKPPSKKSEVKSIPCGVYRHYKGPHYLVLGLACHSETQELCVVYSRLYARESFPLWVRPLANFTGMAINARGKKIKRFTYVGLKEPKPKR